MHVQSRCFAHKTNCFLTLSLSSSKWLLKLPTGMRRCGTKEAKVERLMKVHRKRNVMRAPTSVQLRGLRSSRHQTISPPTKSPLRSLLATIFTSAKTDTVHLPEIVTSSLSPNTSFSTVIDTLSRTSHA